MKLSIVIPVFNEEATLATLLPRVRAAAASVDGVDQYEIVAVDDMSSDASPQILRDQAARHGRHGGGVKARQPRQGQGGP